MGRALQQRLATKRFEGPHHEAVLNIILASNHLLGKMAEVFSGEGLTQAQYNVLRILNGRWPEGYPRGEIARRVMDRAPDLTRMVDRLVRRGFVQRSSSPLDARQSIASITPRGRELLASMHSRVARVQREMAKSLTAKEARELSRLCEKLYGEE